MTHPPLTFVRGAAARRMARMFPSFRDFVDDALFHPQWGYYSTGKVRFGEGGHYDTFPLALSPLFGTMLAHCAYRFWCRAGQPAHFEMCELGAGNGQLALDVLVSVNEGARNRRSWERFKRALRYRIIERSPGLIARQRQQLGPLANHVTWVQADLSRHALRRVPLAHFGIVFANEVLDCLAHHTIVRQPDGTPGVVFIVPQLSASACPRRGSLETVPGVGPADRAVPRAELAKVFGSARLRPYLTFQEVVLPVYLIPRLQTFLQRHYPEFFAGTPRFKPYFACPAIETLMRNTASLYWVSEMLWIDYGDLRNFHLSTPERRRVFAGPPRSGATVYRAPGLDDITFLVDFSVVGAAAEDAGLRVKFYGDQGALARRSGVALDRPARDLITRYRALGWMLAIVGVGPERAWRHAGFTWTPKTAKGGRLRADVNKAVAEFVGQRSSNFRLMILD